ncbi:MAG: response regulator [Cyanosarcina radialis HA8281-LM2]|jgi:DNA-binding response OmpR family regulator|nr:response regulator [Cyanosarcina radialis HA8281-LM2]
MNKILVIESSSIYRNEICRILQFKNYQVIKAENGTDGLNLALEKHPDLVICDVYTSDLTGYQVLEHLRSNASGAKIPFILLGGKTDADSYSCAMKLGASAYLSKLAPPDELLQVVATNMK